MKIYKNKTGKDFLVAPCDCTNLQSSEYVELVANTTDAAQEKHVPVVTVSGDTVTVDVGSVAHPMTEEHSIKFIVLKTDRGFQYKQLESTGAPKAEFKLAAGEKAVAAYEYCNLHGLWVFNI